MPWFRQLVPESAPTVHFRLPKALATDADLRDAVRSELRARGLVADDDLG